jgi:homoserine O-acetyltransferase
MTFPEYTVRDMIRLQKGLLDKLGVTRLKTVIGGSLGGMQVLEWPLLYPETVETIIPIATASRHSAWCIGLNDLSGRQSSWTRREARGDPAISPNTDSPSRGRLRRFLYRSDVSFQERFGGTGPGGTDPDISPCGRGFRLNGTCATREEPWTGLT